MECASEACIDTLLNHGAETNVVDVNLTTPLHLAATHGSISIATLLLERDARVNAPDTVSFFNSISCLNFNVILK